MKNKFALGLVFLVLAVLFSVIIFTSYQKTGISPQVYAGQPQVKADHVVEVNFGSPETVQPKITIQNPEKTNFKSVTGFYTGTGPEKTDLTTNVVAVEPMAVDKATIQLPKKGQVDVILKCANFNLDLFFCPQWEITNIPFTDFGDYIEFEVSSFSGYAGASRYQISQITCGQTLTESAVLESDLACAGDNPIIFGADGITLDGAGYAIFIDGIAIIANGRSGIQVKNLTINGGNCQPGEDALFTLNGTSIQVMDTNLNGDETCTAISAADSDIILIGGIFDSFLDGIVSTDAYSLDITGTTISNIFNAGIEANYINTLSVTGLTCDSAFTCFNGDEINTVTIDSATATDVNVFANIDPVTTTITDTQINQTAQEISLPAINIISGGTVNFNNLIIDGIGIAVSGGANLTSTNLDFFSSNSKSHGLMNIDAAPVISLNDVTGTVSDGATGITITDSDNITLNNIVLTGTDAAVQGVQITDADYVVVTGVTTNSLLGGIEIINTPTITASSIVANNIFGTALDLSYGTIATINGITVNTAGTAVSADEIDSISIINGNFDNVSIAFAPDYEVVVVNNTDITNADTGISAIASDALSSLELNGVTMSDVGVGVEAYNGILNADQVTISAITTGINATVADATITNSTIGDAQTGLYIGAGADVTLGPGMNICGNSVKDIINYGQLTVVPTVYADKVVGSSGPFSPCQNWWNIPNLDITKSTDLDHVPDLSSVDLTLASSTVSVNWLTNVDARNNTFLTNIAFGPNFFSQNTSNLNPTMNTSAAVSMSGINCQNFQLYYAPGFYTTSTALISAGQIIATEANIGGNCNDASICTGIQCSNNNLTFTAQHFSGFAAANGTALTIWDDTDTLTKYVNQVVKFYANYSNATSGAPITGASCNITFQLVPLGPFVMTYNAGSTFYEYNRTFSSPGPSNWDVNCSAAGFPNLKATDTVSIATTPGIPEFSTYAMLLALVIVIAGFFFVQRRKV